MSHHTLNHRRIALKEAWGLNPLTRYFSPPKSPGLFKGTLRIKDSAYKNYNNLIELLLLKCYLKQKIR